MSRRACAAGPRPRDTVKLPPVALRVAAIPAVAIIALLAVGCGATQPGPYRATAGTCSSFGVRAIQERRTVTALAALAILLVLLAAVGAG